MKTPYHLSLPALTGLSAKRAFQLMLMVGAMSGFAHGQILEDNFSGSGSVNLAGRMPDTADAGGAIWNVFSDGGNTVSGGVENYNNVGDGELNSLAYSGSHFSNGNTYALTVNFTLNGGGWFGIGFGTQASGGGSLFGNTTTATLLINNGPGSFVAWYPYDSSSGTGALNNPGTSSGTMQIQLAVDNTGTGTLTYWMGPNANSLTEIAPDPAYHYTTPYTLTPAELASITGVGFTANGNVSGTVKSFELSVVPEPGSYAMVALGLGALVLGVRLRRMTGRV